MSVSALRQEFILHFGEMGSRWGINRTVGQVYALLFLADEPLCADDIVAALKTVYDAVDDKAAGMALTAF